MGYAYTEIDGERVEVHVARAYQALEAAFTARFGLGLIVASGTRTRAEQAALWRAYQNGGTLAAYPGYSNHEETGPVGPRALDIWDTGTDPGVTTYGTERAQWLRANAPRYGFNPAGYGFSQTEPWHYEYTGSLTSALPASNQSEEDDMTPEQAKKLNQIHDRLFNDLTGERIAGAVWAQNGIGAKINRMADRVFAVYESVRYGKKGVRTTGSGIADIQQRTGRIELQQEALLAAVKTLADERGIDGEKLVQAVAKSVDKALADVSITLSTQG